MTTQHHLLHRRNWLSLAASSAIAYKPWPSLTAKLHAATASAGQCLQISTQVDGRHRNALLYVPSAASGQQPLPLLLAFHPYLMPNLNFQRYVNLIATAESNGFVLLMPRGTGWAFFRGFNSNLTDTSPQLLPSRSDTDDVALVQALLQSLPTWATIDHSRIYALGMSNGGMFTHTLAQRMPGLLAGIVSVSGTPIAPLSAATPPTPVMIVHGTADPITPWSGPSRSTPGFIKFIDVDSAVNQWRSLNQSGPEPQLSIIDRPGDQTRILQYLWPNPPARAETVLIRIENGGHRWPAYELKRYYPRTGPQSQDIQMTDFAWAFLSRQRRHLA